MEVLLIRHALPVTGDAADPAADPADPGLGGTGRRQAARLAARLRTMSVDAIAVSPLRRAVETARPVADALGQVPTVIDGLAEWDRDAEVYVPVEELQASDDARWRAMASGDLGALGVDLGQFRRRVEQAMGEIVESQPGGRVAVICHGGVINVYTAAVVSLATPLWFEPGYTSISRVRVARSGQRGIASLNDTSHLESP